jgi:outer membrane protein assembly factor BamB
MIIRFAVALATAAASLALAADWPQFRGPAANGHVDETLVPLRWSTNENIIWITEMPGPGSSSPIVSKGRVFLTCWSGYGLDPQQPGEASALKRHALCLDRRDGRILWDHTVPAPTPETPYQGPYLPQHGYASATPVTDGTNVFFFLGKSGVFAITRDGKKLWEANVGTNKHDWGTGASPILYKDLVIVNAAMESDTLFGLRQSTGEVVWKVRGFARAWNTPALVDAGGAEPELVVALAGRLRAFEPATGKELWNCRAINAAELCPSIVAHQGVIYLLGHPAGQAMAVRAGGRGDVTATHVLWQINKGSNVSSPVYHEGHLYFAHDSRAQIYCLKAATGEVVWEQPLQPKPDKIYASPVLVDGRLYFVTRNRGTFVIEARPEFKLLAHNPPLAPAAFNGSPAVSDGQVFLRSERAVYCIGSR